MYEDDLWSVLLAAASFTIFYTKNRLKVIVWANYYLYVILFSWETNTLEWELIRQQKQTQTNKVNIHKNSKIVYQDYKVGDKTMLNYDAGFKYETSYNGQFETTECWTNGRII